MMGLYLNKVIAFWKYKSKIKFLPTSQLSISSLQYPLNIYISQQLGKIIYPKPIIWQCWLSHAMYQLLYCTWKMEWFQGYRTVVSILTVVTLLTGSWGHTATDQFMKDYCTAHHWPSKEVWFLKNAYCFWSIVSLKKTHQLKSGTIWT